MTYTEEEAKTKWCPFAKKGDFSTSGYGGGGESRSIMGGHMTSLGVSPYFGSCIASECMAWQQTDNKTWPSAPGEPERKPEPAGYCGLAGQPHG